MNSTVIISRLIQRLFDLQLFCLARALLRSLDLDLQIAPVTGLTLTVLPSRHEDQLRLADNKAEVESAAYDVAGVTIRLKVLSAASSSGRMAATRGDARQLAQALHADCTDPVFVAVPELGREVPIPFDWIIETVQPSEGVFDELINDGLCECRACAQPSIRPEKLLILSSNQSFRGEASCMAADLEPLLDYPHQWVSVAMSDLSAAGPIVQHWLDKARTDGGWSRVVIARGGNLSEEKLAEFKSVIGQSAGRLADSGVEVHIALGHANRHLGIEGVDEYDVPRVLANSLANRLRGPDAGTVLRLARRIMAVERLT